MSLINKLNVIIAELDLDPIELSEIKGDAKISFEFYDDYELLYNKLMASKRSMAGYSIEGTFDEKIYTMYLEAI
tara:strand:- start:203 stop:424 length:222 start_codon:yes stop_codon:yes gene_type:complete